MFGPAHRRLSAEADAFMQLGLRPAAQPAGLYHNYFCPRHAVELSFDPTLPGRHVCPTDGEVFSGEPFDSAWRWGANHLLGTMTFRLALLWRLGNDERLADRAQQILWDYARHYPGYPINQRPRGSGKATFQSLDEANLLLPLCRGYDLLADRFTAKERQQLTDNLFRPAAQHLITYRFNLVHNIECWHNAALAALGLLLEDRQLVDDSVNGPFGFHRQLDDGFGEDGYWWEGSSSYHFYTITALTTHAEVMQQTAPELATDPRLEAMFLVPLRLVLPDKRLPAFNDCWFFSSLTGMVCHGTPEAPAQYEAAFDWFGRPEFAQVIRWSYPDGTRDSLQSLLHGQTLPPAGDFVPADHDLLRPSGIALLRSGTTLESSSVVALKAGPAGGTHGHPDKLSVSWYASGEPVSVDLGTPGYGIDLHQKWFRQTVSHNTLVVDGISQPQLEAGTPWLSPPFTAARVTWPQDAGPYAGLSAIRILGVAPDYFVDFLVVDPARECQMDWWFRLDAQWQAASGLQSAATPVLSGDGYQYVEVQEALVGASPGVMEWRTQAGRGLRLYLPAPSGELIVRGAVPHNPASHRSQTVLRRRQGAGARFVAVFHEYGQRARILTVTPIELPQPAAGVAIDTAAGREVWLAGPTAALGATAAEARADGATVQVLDTAELTEERP